MKSSYDNEGFVTILPRMGGYANQSMPPIRSAVSPRACLGARRSDRRRAPKQAEWLSSINLSEVRGGTIR